MLKFFSNLQLTHNPAVGLQLREDPRFTDYCSAVYRAIWVEGQNMNDPTTVASEQAVKDKLKTENELAVFRGVFGAPTFFVADQMFWGQDRLDFVHEALVL